MRSVLVVLALAAIAAAQVLLVGPGLDTNDVIIGGTTTLWFQLASPAPTEGVELQFELTFNDPNCQYSEPSDNGWSFQLLEYSCTTSSGGCCTSQNTWNTTIPGPTVLPGQNLFTLDCGEQFFGVRITHVYGVGNEWSSPLLLGWTVPSNNIPTGSELLTPFSMVPREESSNVGGAPYPVWLSSTIGVVPRVEWALYKAYGLPDELSQQHSPCLSTPFSYVEPFEPWVARYTLPFTTGFTAGGPFQFTPIGTGNFLGPAGETRAYNGDSFIDFASQVGGVSGCGSAPAENLCFVANVLASPNSYGAFYTFDNINQTYTPSTVALALPSLPDWTYQYGWQWYDVNRPLLSTAPNTIAQTLSLRQPYLSFTDLTLPRNGLVTGLNVNITLTRVPVSLRNINANNGVNGVCTVTQGPANGLTGFGGGVLELIDGGTGATGGWDDGQASSRLLLELEEVGFYQVTCTASGYLPDTTALPVYDRNLPAIWEINSAHDPVSLEWLDDSRPLLAANDVVVAMNVQPPSNSDDTLDYYYDQPGSNVVYSFARTDSAAASAIGVDFTDVQTVIVDKFDWLTWANTAAGNISFSADGNGNLPGTYTIGYTVANLRDGNGVNDYIRVRINRVGFSLWCENMPFATGTVSLSWLQGPIRCTIGLQQPLAWAQTFDFVRDADDSLPDAFAVVASDLPLTIPAGETMIKFRIEPVTTTVAGAVTYWLEPAPPAVAIPGGNITAWLGAKPNCGGFDIAGATPTSTTGGGTLQVRSPGACTVVGSATFARIPIQFSTAFSNYKIQVDSTSGSSFVPSVAIYAGQNFDPAADCPLAGGPGVDTIGSFAAQPNTDYIIAVFDTGATGSFSIEIEANACRGSDGTEYYSEASATWTVGGALAVAAEMQQGLMDWRHGDVSAEVNITISRLPKWGDVNVLLLQAASGSLAGPQFVFEPSVVTFQNETTLCPDCATCPERCYVTVLLLPRSYYWGTTLAASFVPDSPEGSQTTAFSLTAVAAGNGGAPTTTASLYVSYSTPLSSSLLVLDQAVAQVSAVSTPFYNAQLLVGGARTSTFGYNLLSSPLITFGAGDVTLRDDIVFEAFGPISGAFSPNNFVLRTSRLSGSFYGTTGMNIDTPTNIAVQTLTLTPTFFSSNSNNGALAGILPGSVVEMTVQRSQIPGYNIPLSDPLTLVVYGSSFPAGLIDAPSNVTIPAGSLTVTFNMNITRAKKNSKVTPNGIGRLCVGLLVPSGESSQSTVCTSMFALGESANLGSASALIGDAANFNAFISPEIVDNKYALDMFVGLGEKGLGFTGMDKLFKYADYPTQKQRFIAGQTTSRLSVQLSAPLTSSSNLLVRTKNDDDQTNRFAFSNTVPTVYIQPKGCSFSPTPVVTYTNLTARLARVVFSSTVVISTGTAGQGACNLPSKHTGEVEFFVQMLYGGDVMQPVRSSFTLSSDTKITGALLLEFDVMDVGAAEFLVYTHNEEYGSFFPIQYISGAFDYNLDTARGIEWSTSERDSDSFNTNYDLVGTHRWVQLPLDAPPSLFGVTVSFVMELIGGEDVYDWSVASSPSYTFSDENNVFLFTGDAVRPGFGQYRLTMVPTQLGYVPVDFVMNVDFDSPSALESAASAYLIDTRTLSVSSAGLSSIGSLLLFTIDIFPVSPAPTVLSITDVAGVFLGLPSSYAVPANTSSVVVTGVLAAWAPSAPVQVAIAGYVSASTLVVPLWSSSYSVSIFPRPESVLLSPGVPVTFTLYLNRPAIVAGSIVLRSQNFASGLVFSPATVSFAVGQQEAQFTATLDTLRAAFGAGMAVTLTGIDGLSTVSSSTVFQSDHVYVVTAASLSLLGPDAFISMSSSYVYGSSGALLAGSAAHAVNVAVVDMSSTPPVTVYSRDMHTSASSANFVASGLYPGMYEVQFSTADSRVELSQSVFPFRVDVSVTQTTSALSLESSSGWYSAINYRLSQPMAVDVAISHALHPNYLLNVVEFVPSAVVVIPAGQWAATVRAYISPTVETRAALYIATTDPTAGPIAATSFSSTFVAAGRAMSIDLGNNYMDVKSELAVVPRFGRNWFGKTKFFHRSVGSATMLSRSGATNNPNGEAASLVAGVLLKSTSDYGRSAAVFFPYNLNSRVDKPGVAQERGVTSIAFLPDVGYTTSSSPYYFDTQWFPYDSGNTLPRTDSVSLGDAYWNPGEMRLLSFYFTGSPDDRYSQWMPTGRELIVQIIVTSGDANLTFDVTGPAPQAGSFSVRLNETNFVYRLWVQASSTPATQISTYLVRATWTEGARGKPNGLPSFVGEFSVGPVIEVHNARTDVDTVNRHFPLSFRAVVGPFQYWMFINNDAVDRRFFAFGPSGTGTSSAIYLANTYSTGTKSLVSTDFTVLPLAGNNPALPSVTLFAADPDGPYWLAGDKDQTIAMASSALVAVSLLVLAIASVLAL